MVKRRFKRIKNARQRLKIAKEQEEIKRYFFLNKT